MKTPERWCAITRRCPCQYSCPIDLLTQTFHTLQQLIMTDSQRPFNYPNENDGLMYIIHHGVILTPWRHGVTSRDVTWRHDITVWRHMTFHVMTVSLHGPSHQKYRKFTFSNMATLTFDLWPWPSNSSEILSRYIHPPNLGPYFKPFSRESADRQTDTHTQTHRRDRFHTLDRLRGREQCSMSKQIKKSSIDIKWLLWIYSNCKLNALYTLIQKSMGEKYKCRVHIDRTGDGDSCF